MSLIQDYFTKTQQLFSKYGKKSLILMQVGSFFEVYAYRNTTTGIIYGSCLEEFVTLCDFAEPSIKHTKDIPKDSEVLMSGFPEYMIDKYAGRMQEHGYTCAIYRQDSNMKHTTRSLDIICSPGTHFTDESKQQLSNNTMCIWIYNRTKSQFNSSNQIMFGMSSIDILNGSCNYNEVVEAITPSNIIASFDEVERYYSIYKPNELLCVYNSVHITEQVLENTLQSLHIFPKSIHLVDVTNNDSFLSLGAQKFTKQTHQTELLNHVYCNRHGLDIQTLKETCGFNDRHIGCQSFCLLLDFIQSHNPNLLSNIQLPTLETSSVRLMLANHSLIQLNILNNNQHTGKLSSVVSFITNSYTSMGKRALKNAIVHPTTDELWLKNEYNMIDYILNEYELYEWIPNSLRQLHDIPYYYRKLVMGCAKPTDISTIYSDMFEINNLYAQMETSKKLTEYASVLQCGNHVTSILALLTKNVHISICKKYNSMNDIQENIFIKGVYLDIDSIEEKYKETCDKIKAIQEYLSNIINEESQKQTKTKRNQRVMQDACKIHNTEKSGAYFKTTTQRCKLLKQHFNLEDTTKISKPKNKRTKTVEYVSTYNGTNETFLLDINLEFTSATGSDKQIRNAQIDDLMMKNLKYKQELQDAIKDKFRQFVKLLATLDTEFYAISKSVSSIDVVYHKAKLAKQYNYCKPTIEEKSIHAFIDATQMRHVLIEQFQNDELYVPNDVCLGIHKKNSNENHDGMLLFGTNAVGKSSLIKSVGICIVMAQSGFYVPCATFRYKPFRQLFTRILGNDNIFKGLSTFAVEMSELNTILRYSTEDSLVLGDELCSGTELGSAISIFCAGLVQLSNIHSKFIFATHFHEITNMEQITSIPSLCMKHMSVIYDAKDDCLIYDRRLSDGPGNNNYGLEVCKSLNLPREFLDLANSIRLNQQPNTKPISMTKKSSYNARKLKTCCELCKKECVEVHHLQHQKEANHDGFINHFHKNHKANLINVCESCHSSFHNSKKQHKRVKTTRGVKVREIET